MTHLQCRSAQTAHRLTYSGQVQAAERPAEPALGCPGACRLATRERKPLVALFMHPLAFAPQFGAVVQLVRIPACHAGGRGFESRPLRQHSIPSNSLISLALRPRARVGRRCLRVKRLRQSLRSPSAGHHRLTESSVRSALALPEADRTGPCESGEAQRLSPRDLPRSASD